MTALPLVARDLEPADAYYEALRDGDQFRDIREQVEVLWRRFEPYADPNFRSEFAANFMQRYWEMYLGCSLLELGYDLKPSSGRGPDLLVSKDNVRAAIEATSVEPGDGPDRVPEPYTGGVEARPIPIPQIVLRIRHAIHEKQQQHLRHQQAGLVPDGSSFVLAIHLGSIMSAHTNAVAPLSAQACLGVGGLAYPISEGSAQEPIVVPRTEIEKKSGTEIDTMIFRDPSYSWISAVLISSVRPFSIPSDRGGFELLHNPLAAIPLPRGAITMGYEYWVEGTRFESECYDAA